MAEMEKKAAMCARYRWKKAKKCDCRTCGKRKSGGSGG